MMNEDRKISTSVQYQISNVKLFYEVFGNWKSFNEKLNSGPNGMKKYLFEMWNTLKEELRSNDVKKLLVIYDEKILTKK